MSLFRVRQLLLAHVSVVVKLLQVVTEHSISLNDMAKLPLRLRQ
jgi:hypothetical protein